MCNLSQQNLQVDLWFLGQDQSWSWYYFLSCRLHSLLHLHFSLRWHLISLGLPLSPNLVKLATIQLSQCDDWKLLRAIRFRLSLPLPYVLRLSLLFVASVPQFMLDCCCQSKLAWDLRSVLRQEHASLFLNCLPHLLLLRPHRLPRSPLRCRLHHPIDRNFELDQMARTGR